MDEFGFFVPFASSALDLSRDYLPTCTISIKPTTMAPLSFLDLPMEIKLKILQQVVHTPNPEQEDMFDMYIEWTPNGGFIVSEDVKPFSLFLVNKSFSVLA